MLKPPSVHVTRLIVRLILSSDLEDLTLTQLENLDTAIENVLDNDPLVLQRIPDIDGYRHQLEYQRLLRINPTLKNVSNTITITSNEALHG